MGEIITIKKDVVANVFVGKCQLPTIYSQGRTKTEALRATKGAVNMFIKHVFKRKINE